MPVGELLTRCVRSDLLSNSCCRMTVTASNTFGTVGHLLHGDLPDGSRFKLAAQSTNASFIRLSA